MPFETTRYFSWCAWALLPLGLGCGAAESAASSSGTEAVGSSHALLRIDVESLLEQDDVSQLRFVAQRVSCAGEAFEPSTVTSDAPVADLLLPVENPTLADQPLAPDSEHAFADKLIALEPGCYDITLTPLGPSGEPSTQCGAASASAVRIVPELTTEIVLISQCSSSAGGLADTVLTFNHPPTLGQPTYVDTRFVETCKPTRLCVTASDLDRDPIELLWAVSEDSAAGVTPPSVVSTTAHGDGSVEQCASVLPRSSGTFELSVTAYDRATLGGIPTRIETLLDSAGSPLTSHASLGFSLLASGTASCAP
jgi:hypothetical protein